MADDRYGKDRSRDALADHLAHETPARIAAEADSLLDSWAAAQAVAIGCFVAASVVRDRDAAVVVSVVGAMIQLFAFFRLVRGVVLSSLHQPAPVVKTESTPFLFVPRVKLAPAGLFRRESHEQSSHVSGPVERRSDVN